jgi:hypothetical protein
MYNVFCVGNYTLSCHPISDQGDQNTPAQGRSTRAVIVFNALWSPQQDPQYFDIRASIDLFLME